MQGGPSSLHKKLSSAKLSTTQPHHQQSQLRPHSTQQPVLPSNTASDSQLKLHHSIGLHSHFSEPHSPPPLLPSTFIPSALHYTKMASTGVNVRTSSFHNLKYSRPPVQSCHPSSHPALPVTHRTNTPHRSSATPPSHPASPTASTTKPASPQPPS